MITTTTAEPSALWESLPKAVSTVISLSALGYFVGWKETQTYYASVGAGWAAASVPSLALLQQSTTTIFATAFGAFYSLVLLHNNNVSTRKLSWACAILFVFSGGCLFASQGVFGNLSSVYAYTLASTGAMLCALAGGITLAEFYGHARASRASISSGHLWLIFWIVLPILFWAPERLGQARSARDMDIKQSPLPLVSIDSTQSIDKWRLVQLLQDKALLVKLDEKEASRQFKIVEAKDIRFIATTAALLTSK